MMMTRATWLMAILLVLGGLRLSPAIAQDATPLQWTRLADMPVGVFDAALSVANHKAIITGGLNQAGETSPLVQVFDLTSHTWTTHLSLPESVTFHAQVTLNDGRIFIAGGKTGSLLKGLKTTARTWLIAADLKSIAPGPDLPAAIHDVTAHILPDGRVIVIAGSRASILDPASNTWDSHIPLREKRQSHASAVLPDGRVIIAGGINRKTFEAIDPVTRISTLLSPRLPQPLDDLAAVTLPDGRVLVLGGQDSQTGETVDTCYVLDVSNPARSTLTPSQSLGIAGGAADMVTVTLGPWLFSLGGETQHDMKDRELTTARIIDMRSLKVFALPDMAVEHDDALVAVDGSGVIIFGGYSVNTIKLGPLSTRMPTAVHIVERLVLPAEKLEEASTATTPPEGASR